MSDQGMPGDTLTGVLEEAHSGYLCAHTSVEPRSANLTELACYQIHIKNKPNLLLLPPDVRREVHLSLVWIIDNGHEV
jgi:hypothetical protein